MPEIGAAQALLLTDAEVRSQNRWLHEQQHLKFFPVFYLLASAGSIIAAEGSLTTQFNNTYAIRIDLKNYPYALPVVRPNGWVVHPQAPHKYADGTLCVMRLAQWKVHFTVALVVAKTAIWLGKYEIWKRNGHTWPGLGQRH